MKEIEKIFNDYKNDRIDIEEAKQEMIYYILNKPQCDRKNHYEIKYLQWQDRWFCCDCQDTIGDTSDIFEGYKGENDDD